MSIKFDLRSICRPLLDGFLPRGSGNEKALLLVLDLRSQVYVDYAELNQECRAACDAAEEDDGVYEFHTEASESISCKLLFVRAGNYTMVLAQTAVGTEQARGMRFKHDGEYAEVGNHDSCWDSYFSTLNDLLRNQGKELVETMVPRLREDLLPNPALHPRPSFHCNIEEIKTLAVELEEIGERKWKVAFPA